jgi:radical SAM superfamily enzyme YgiQ (UPF0313 family)
MKTSLHLLAMPLAYPLHPSSQLGYLHGFVEQTFGDRIPVRSHHAFLPILHAVEGIGMVDFFQTYSLAGEEILYLACAYQARQSGAGDDFLPARSFEDALQAYNSYRDSPQNEAQQPLIPISREKIVALSEAMVAYLDQVLIPSLREDCLNVIGMTASFCQVLGSVFAARHIQQNTQAPVLFVFGGSSYSLPEGTRTLSRWGIDGLLVAGSGEAPLQQLLEACLALEPHEPPAATIASRGLVNVTRIGDAPRPLDLSMAKDYMGQLPDPNYDDYFAALRAMCSDNGAYQYALGNLVSIPLEGARGCFAKCDFCHNPNITSQFRSLTGDQVAQRALSMIDRYGVPDITFVDSVSNTWAEGYADYLLARGRVVKAFAEMRVHAPEAFWVKLALSGCTTIQLGVESIAEPLLKSMRKNTTVMQNLAATKYMAEMGTSNASNLIIHHPKSTVADVQETRRVMKHLEHFPIFSLSSFVVSYASPIYNELSEEKKAQLHRGFDWLADEFEPYTWPRHLSYTWPREWYDPETLRAWLDFQAWYADHERELRSRPAWPTFTVDRMGDRLALTDTRFGQDRRYTLSGNAMRVFDICHVPRTAEQVVQETGLAAPVVAAELATQEADKSLIRIGDRYLSIAFRPRSELIQNWRSKPDRRAQRASAVAAAQVNAMR